MESFINEYKYTHDVISEGISAWWHKKYNFKKGCLLCSILFLLILLLSLYEKRWELLALELLPSLILLLMIPFLHKKVKLAVQSEQERIKVIFPDGVPVVQVKIGGDICMITPKAETRVRFSDVEDVIETKNLIVLIIKGMMTVTLDKRGFQQGNADECMRFIKGNLTK